MRMMKRKYPSAVTSLVFLGVSMVVKMVRGQTEDIPRLPFFYTIDREEAFDYPKIINLGKFKVKSEKNSSVFYSVFKEVPQEISCYAIHAYMRFEESTRIEDIQNSNLMAIRIPKKSTGFAELEHRISCKSGIWSLIASKVCRSEDGTSYIHETFMMNTIEGARKSKTEASVNDLPKYLDLGTINLFVGYNRFIPWSDVRFYDLKIFLNFDFDENNFDKLTGSPMRLLKYYPFFDMDKGKIRDIVKNRTSYIESYEGNAKPIDLSLEIKPADNAMISFSIDQKLVKESMTISFWFALDEKNNNAKNIDFRFVGEKNKDTGHVEYTAEVLLRGAKIEDLRSNDQAMVRINSKIWNFFKLTLYHHQLDQRYYIEYLLLAVSPPFSISSVFTHRQRKHTIFSQDGSLRSEIFRSNIHGRVSQLKIFKGNFGNFFDKETFGVKDFINPLAQYCKVSTTMNYYKLNFEENQKILVRNIKEDCDFCSIETDQGSKSSEYNEFGIVWNGDYCVSDCYENQKKDSKTGSCWEYIPQLGNVSAFTINSSKFDEFLCGNGIVESSNNETCEKYGTKLNVNCTDKCQSKDQVVCRIDYLGQSSCSPCNLDFCNKYMGVGNDISFKKDCLAKCRFYEDAYLGKLSYVSNLTGVEIYLDREDNSLKTCSAFAFNVGEKIDQESGSSVAFEYCQKCILNDVKANRTLASKELYIMDKKFKLCFPVERETELSIGSFILSDIFISVMSYYTIITASILAVITPIILVPTNTSVIFYSFWELLQVNYMWSYHLAKDSASRQLFKNLKFVNFEFDFLDPFLSRFILSQMVDADMGIKLLSKEGMVQYNEIDYQIYKIAYEKYFQNGKIAVLLYDAAPLFDIILVLIFLTVFFKFTHHLCTVIFVESRSSIIKFLGFMRKLFGKKLYLRIFFEIQPVLMFHCLSQGLFFNTDAQNMFSVFTLTNKIVLSLVMFTVVFGLPVYSFLAIFEINNDKSIEVMIYKSAKTTESNKKPKSISALFYLNMTRKMLFSLMFLPALESANSAWFAFLIMLIQIITLTIIINEFPYVNDIVNYNQFGTSFIQMIAALTILLDKVVDNLKVLSLNAESKKAIKAYEIFREHYLILTFLTMITVYMVSALAMVWIGKRKLKNFYLKIFYGYDEDDEALENFKGIQLVSLPRY